MKSLRAFLLLIILTILTSCRSGGGIAVTEPWAREANQGENSAVYFTISNRGPADLLLSVKAPAASQVQLHRSIVDDDGVVSMQPEQSIPLGPGEKVAFEPGGLHIMLIDVQQNLVDGDSINVTLIFEYHDPIDFSAEIRSP